jgi:hypothetical protein
MALSKVFTFLPIQLYAIRRTLRTAKVEVPVAETQCVA